MLQAQFDLVCSRTGQVRVYLHIVFDNFNTGHDLQTPPPPAPVTNLISI